MPQAKRVYSSGSGLGTNIASQLGPAYRPTSGRSGRPDGRSSNRRRRSGQGGNLAAALDAINARQATLREQAGDKGDGGLMGLFKDVSGAVGDGLKGALDALDTPRAALLAFGSEIGEGLEGQQGGFSLDDFIKKTRDNYNFGEFLHDEVAQTDDWNGAAKFAAGLTGDILLDPLTWVAPGSKIGELGAKGAAGALLKATDDDLLRAGLTRGGVEATAASVLQKRSASLLSDAERGMVAGGERGVYLNAPGTGRIGRRLGIDKAIDAVTGGRYGLAEGDRLFTKQLRLGGGKGFSKAHELAMTPVAKVMNSKATKSLVRGGANGQNALMQIAMRSGDPEQAKNGFFTLEATALGRNQDKKFAQEFETRANNLVHEAEKAGVDDRDMWLVAGGDQPAMARVVASGPKGQEFVDRTRALFDDAEKEANRVSAAHGGGTVVQHRENYTARFLNKDAREAMGLNESNFPRKGGLSSIDAKRKYGTTGADGETDMVLGRPLFGVDDVKNNPAGLSEEEQIHRILEANGINNGKGWFMESAKEAFPLYGKVLSKRVGDEVSAGVLKQRGIGRTLMGETAADEISRVAARTGAVRKSEIARRRAGVAERAATQAEGLADEAVQDATRQATEAAAASKGARGAAQAAAAEVGTVEHTGAAAVREFGDISAEAAQDQADSLSRYLGDQMEAIDRTSTEVAALRIDSVRLRETQRDLHYKVRFVSEARSQAYEEMTVLWKALENRLQTVPHIRKVEAEIAKLHETIMGLNDQMDEMVEAIAPSRRRPATIQRDLDGVLAKQRSLGGKLTAAVRRDDGAAADAIRAEMETNRNFRESLRIEQSTGKRIDRETQELLEAGKDEVTKHRERILMLQQVAEEEGRDADAVAYGLMAERLPAPSEDGLLLTPIFGDPDWYHGTPIGVDLGNARPSVLDSQRATDSFFGTHWAAGQDDAARYREASAAGDLGEEGAGGVAKAQLSIKNPKMYPEVPDPEWGVMTEAAEMYKFGTGMGQGKMEWLDDIMSDGFRAGEITVDDLYEGIKQLFHPTVVHDDEALEHLYDLTDQVVEMVNGGVAYRAALTDVFSFSEMDPVTWGQHRVAWANEADAGLTEGDRVVASQLLDDGTMRPEHGPGRGWIGTDEARASGIADVSDERVGNWMATQLDWQINPEVRQRAAESWKASHGQYDGVLYDHGSFGGWSAVPFDDAQVRGLDGPIRDLHTVKAELQDLMATSARKATDAAWDLDSQVADLALEGEQVAKRANDVDKRIVAAERRLVSQRAQVSAKTKEMLTEEVTHLKEAQRQYGIADRMQQDFVEEQMLRAQQLNVDAKLAIDTEAQQAVHNGRQIAVLEARAATLRADATKWAKTADKYEGKALDLLTPDVEKGMQAALADGYKQFGSSTLLPDAVAESMTAATRMSEPGFLKGVLGTFDWVQNLWKGYATMSPGFLTRNTLGIFWNNYAADINRDAYKWYMKSSLRDGKGVPKVWKEAFDASIEAGVHTGGQAVGSVVAHSGRVSMAKRLFPGTTDFQPIRAIRAGSADAENMGRCSLFMDVYVKTGGDVGASVEAVNKFHFDYDDLSKLERSVLRRAVPFYTWTRKNLPLQLEMIARKPAKFNKFTQAKAEAENLSAQEGVVPGYFGENMAVRLPWTREGGNVYYFPDLPFAKINDATDLGKMAGNLSPFLKTPIEMYMGKQVWNDQKFTDKLVPPPALAQAIPGLMPALEQVGWATKNAEGEWVMKDRHMSALTSLVPPFAQSRRLFPNEDKYQERHLTSLLSYLGAGLRTNTSSEQQGVVWGAYYDLKDEIARLEKLGFLTNVQKAAAVKKYGDSSDDPMAPLMASDSLLEDFELSEESNYENEELNSFKPYEPK